RSGHTITELNGQALVLGGVNGSGAVLSSSAVVASSGASITTDKMDYAPGEIATITGRGFGAGEVVRLKIHEDPHTPQERGLDVTADADGNFTGDYLVMEYDLDMKFIVGARGLTSGRTAQTTFTDARLNTLTVGAQSPNPVTPGSSASYTVTVGFNGNATNCTVNLTALGLPTGVGFSFTPSSVTGSGVVNINSALSVSTLVSTPGGSHPFTVRATTTAGCQNHPATIDASATLVVAGDADTTTTVNNATATYGDLSVNLSATVSSTSTVNVGTVTFTVKQGATTIGVATTSGTVSGGNASVSYALPAGTDAGPYTIEATYNAGAGFNTSSGTGSLTINKRDIEVTADPKSKVYGDADPALTYQITSGSLVFGDTIVGALARAAGENVGTYAITQGTLAINDGNGGNNYNLTFVGADFTITARPITITADPKSKVYGDPDPALTYQITSGSLAFSDAIVGALVRAAGENVGTYAITQGTLAINDGNGGNNYNLTFVSANLSITKRPIQVTATAGQFKIYGDPDPVFAYTLTSGTLAFSDTFTGALSRVAGENVGLYAITIGTLKVNDGNNGDNYNLTLVSNNFEIKKRLITVKADAKTKTFGDPDPVFTYQITSGSLAFTDTFTGALTRDPGELVGVYAIKIGTLAINDGNGGNNYTLTLVGDNLTILTACSVFNGFLSPIGGAVEKGNGGSFADPVRAFKLNSTIPVKFNAICFGTPLVTGVHTLQAIKYSNSTDSEPAIDATPTDAATMGNQFRLTGTEWHFNLNTKALGGNAQGTWLLKATLFDGSSYTVWVSIKK
ncbi:MAG TPA: MBG domain-containing protein, partial [Pyrinomonadaceae bacterium]|nr:MBG domain-containing protein [Pyrinomonadaceae bacterium]